MGGASHLCSTQCAGCSLSWLGAVASGHMSVVYPALSAVFFVVCSPREGLQETGTRWSSADEGGNDEHFSD